MVLSHLWYCTLILAKFTKRHNTMLVITAALHDVYTDIKMALQHDDHSLPTAINIKIIRSVLFSVNILGTRNGIYDYI